MRPNTQKSVEVTRTAPSETTGNKTKKRARRSAEDGHIRTYLGSAWTVRLASLSVVLVAWQIVGSMLNPIFLSTPVKIVAALVQLFANGELLPALWLSLAGVAIGFAGGALVGVTLGLIMGRWRRAEWALDPYVNALFVTPSVALIPILLIWFGIGFQAQLVIIFIGAVIPITINTFAGVRNINREWIDAARSFCANDRQIFLDVIIPGAVPHIMTGLRLGIGHAVISMVVAQMFLALSGLGQLLVVYGDFFKTAYVFAVVIVIGSIGVILTECVKAADRHFAHWSRSDEGWSF